MARAPIQIRFRRMKDKLGTADINKWQITLNPDQTDKSLMGSAIHEVLHLEQWDLAEEAIVRMEKSLVDVLTRLNFERVQKCR